MARREYLSAEERQRVDTPPQLTPLQRTLLLDLPPWAEAYLATLFTPTNQIGFLLQLGYFRIVARFFVADRFPAADIDWLCQQLKLPRQDVELAAYDRSQSAYRHRTLILDKLGYEAFTDTHQTRLLAEARRLTHLHTKPALLFDHLMGYLREQRIEAPPYHTIRTLITQALDDFDAHLQTLIETHLRSTDKALLDALLVREPTLTQFPLTKLKHIGGSMQPKQIAGRVDQFRQVKTLFVSLAPLITRLELPDETIRYYAQYVFDSRSTQFVERMHDRYLRLLAFITHQYLSLGDALILTLLKAVSTLGHGEYSGSK